jgi:hypothetical protein
MARLSHSPVLFFATYFWTTKFVVIPSNPMSLAINAALIAGKFKVRRYVSSHVTTPTGE